MKKIRTTCLSEEYTQFLWKGGEMEEVQEKSCVWKKLKRESNCNILQKGHIPFHVESIFKGWTSEGWHTICGIFTGILKCLDSWILQWNNQSNNSCWSSVFYLLHGMQNYATIKRLRNGTFFFLFLGKLFLQKIPLSCNTYKNDTDMDVSVLAKMCHSLNQMLFTVLYMDFSYYCYI